MMGCGPSLLREDFLERQISVVLYLDSFTPISTFHATQVTEVLCSTPVRTC